MSEVRPRSLISRTLALLVLLGALFGCYRLVVAPIVSAYKTEAQSMERSLMLLRRYRVIAAQGEELAEAVAAREKMAGENATYVYGRNGALAAAALQDHVASVIAQAGGELRSTQVLPSEPVDAVVAVTRSRLRLHLDVDVEGLERLLYDLETSSPYLFIEQITIQTQARHDDPEQQRLVVSLDVYGYARSAEL